MSIENNYNNDAGNEFDANGPGKLPVDFQPAPEQGRREDAPIDGEENTAEGPKGVKLEDDHWFNIDNFAKQLLAFQVEISGPVWGEFNGEIIELDGSNLTSVEQIKERFFALKEAKYETYRTAKSNKSDTDSADTTPLGTADSTLGTKVEGMSEQFMKVEGVGELTQDGIDATAMNAESLTKLAEEHGDISTWPKEVRVKAKAGFLATMFSGMRKVAAAAAFAVASTAQAGGIDINQMTQIGIQAANQEAQLRMQESNQLRQIESQKQSSLMQIDNSTRTQLMQIELQITQTMSNPQIPAAQKEMTVQQLRSQQEQVRVNGENMKQSLIMQMESSKQQTAASLQAAREQTRNNAKASIIQNALSNLLRR